MPTPKLTTEILNAAIDGYEAQKARIDTQIAELRAMLSGGATQPTAASEPRTRKNRRLSAAGRKRIAEAARKRWAAVKAAKEAPEPVKPKRNLSAAAKAKLVANLKKARAAKAAKAESVRAEKAAPARRKAAVKKAAAAPSPAKAAAQ